MNSKDTLLDIAFLALCVQSEDERDPSAKELIVEIILNRTKSKKFPSTLFNVISQKEQFSYFNSVRGMKKDFYDLDLIEAGTFGGRKVRRVDWRKALDSVVKKICITDSGIELDENKRVLHPGFVYMYAPRSMKNPSLPPWWWKAEVKEEYKHNDWVFGRHYQS